MTVLFSVGTVGRERYTGSFILTEEGVGGPVERTKNTIHRKKKKKTSEVVCRGFMISSRNGRKIFSIDRQSRSN